MNLQPPADEPVQPPESQSAAGWQPPPATPQLGWQPPPATPQLGWQPPPATPQQGWQQQPYMQPNHPYIQPKNPAVAVVASLLLPGLGSMISGNAGMGVLILCLYAVSFVFWLLFLIGVPFTIGFWIWGMVQAHADAVKWNRQHGILS